MERENNVIRSPISGFGTKCRACIEARLHEYLPNFTTNRKIYVEPFAFSAVIFLNTNSKRALLNDIDFMIYNFWTVLKNKYDEFIKELNFTYVGKSWFDEYQSRVDDVGRAIFFYICAHAAHTNISTEHFKFKYAVNEFKKNLDYIKKRFDSMQSLTIWNLHFRDVYKKLMGKGGKEFEFVWYVDPPYIIKNTGYNTSMTIQEHEELAKYHQKMKDEPLMHIIISYNECEKVRELYEGWFIKEISFATGSVNRGKGEYHELLISNREITRRAVRRKEIF